MEEECRAGGIVQDCSGDLTGDHPSGTNFVSHGSVTTVLDIETDLKLPEEPECRLDDDVCSIIDSDHSPTSSPTPPEEETNLHDA